MIEHIRPAQLGEWLAHNRSAGLNTPLVLDVREPWEVQLASVQPDGFELVVMPMASIPARLNELPRDKPIACLCHHGARSAQVVHFLMQQGFSNVVNVYGGINAWSAEVDPSVPRY